MNAKRIIVLVFGLLSLAVTAWKGPETWHLVASAIAAVCLTVGTLHVLPVKDEEYIQDLEAAVQQTNGAPALAPKSKIRYLRRKGN